MGANAIISDMRTHKVALVIAVAVSFLYGMHHFLMPHFMPEGLVYKPVTYESDHDAGGYYGPRADAFFSRNQVDSPSFLPMLNPLILGGLGKLLGSMERAYVVSDFLFPPLIFLAVYALACEVLCRRLPALCLSSIFIVSPLAALLSPYAPFLAAATPLYFSGFEYPKITFLFYVGALFFITRAITHGGRKNILLAGIFFGSLFYTYLYDWAYIVVALFCMFVWFVSRREWNTVKSCGSIMGVGALISVPYWFNFVVLRRLPQYQDIIFRIGGLEVGRSFRFSFVWKTYARHLLWVAALVMTSLKRIPRQVIFLTSLLAAYFVVINVQVVLGFSPQPDHWYRETFLPVTLSFGVVGIWVWDRYGAHRLSKKVAATLAAAFLTLFFIQAFYGQYQLSRNRANVWGLGQNYADAYSWLAEHTESEAVVGSVSRQTNREIALHAHRRVFLPSGFNTSVSNQELWERLSALAALAGFTEEQFRAFATAESRYLFQEYYNPRVIDSYFKTAQSWSFSEEELTIHTAEFSKTRHAFSYTTPYRLDYMVIGPREKLIASVTETFEAFPLVYDREGVTIRFITYGNKP